MEDDDGWLEAAMEDSSLVANVLTSLTFDSKPALRWKGRRPRSRMITMAGILAAKWDAEMEAAMRGGSPTTPLSWSSGSGTSSSACDLDVAGSSLVAVAKKNKKRARTAAGGRSTNNKGPVVLVNESTPLKRIRRPGPAKKMPSSELQETYDTFAKENMELNRQIEIMRINQRELIEENARLEEETKKKFKLTPETETMPIQERGLHSNSPTEKLNTMGTDFLVSEDTSRGQQLQGMPSTAVRAYAIDLNQPPPADV